MPRQRTWCQLVEAPVPAAQPLAAAQHAVAGPQAGQDACHLHQDVSGLPAAHPFSSRESVLVEHAPAGGASVGQGCKQEQHELDGNVTQSPGRRGVLNEHTPASVARVDAQMQTGAAARRREMG